MTLGQTILDLHIFYSASDFRGCDLNCHHAGGSDQRILTADLTLSANRSADYSSHLLLSRCQCGRGDRHDRRTDRAKGQRRRQVDVHAVAVDQRRHVHPYARV